MLYPRRCPKCENLLSFDKVEDENITYCSGCNLQFKGYSESEDKEIHEMFMNMSWGDMKEFLLSNGLQNK